MELVSGQMEAEFSAAGLNNSQDLLDNAPAIIWIVDADLRLRRAGGAPAGWGLAAENCAGKPVEALFRGSGEAHRRALGGKRTRLTLEANGRDYEALLEPLRGPGGSVEGIAGVAIDLTDRLVADRALRLSEQSYRCLIEEAPYAICRSTATGQLLQVNRAMLDFLDYGVEREAELLMRDLPEIFSTTASFSDFRDRLLRNEAEGIDAIWSGRTGSEIQVHVSGRAVRGASDEAQYLDIIAENITEKRQLEAQLNQGHKMQALGQLAGGVAHDFNNLLMVIGGQVEMILRKTLDEDTEERLKDIRKAADRAAALTRQLLAFSRRQVLQSRTLDVNDIIRHTTGLLLRLLRENVELAFSPAPERALIRADPNQIEQVLMNLAINAQDAMPQGGRITVSTAIVHESEPEAQRAGQIEAGDYPRGDYVRITVADTGYGMDAETQARIFEPFFTTKAVGEGTGLGLAMVYGVVRQSGGRICVDSKPGAGTTFNVDLPLATTEEATPQEPQLTGSPRGQETILLAEDEEGVRMLVETYLGQLGYRVLTAATGGAALDVARGCSWPIDLLITDVVMPGMGGRELAATLSGRIGDMGVLFISGYAGDSESAEELAASGARFLQKPFSMDALARTVRATLDEKVAVRRA